MFGIGTRHQNSSGAATSMLSRSRHPKPPLAMMSSYPSTELARYRTLSESLGISLPDQMVEQAKAFLNEKEMTVFDHRGVVAYMDKIALTESKDQAGWVWKPLRAKDASKRMSFGTALEREWLNYGRTQVHAVKTKASDHCTSNVYALAVPMHALEKVERIEKEFLIPNDVKNAAFFISDYEVAPAMYRDIPNPDPFLMFAIDNPNIMAGVGRFVVDVWDEPGFGLANIFKANIVK